MSPSDTAPREAASPTDTVGAPKGDLAARRDQEAARHASEESRQHRISSALGFLRLVVFAAIVVFLIQAVRTTPDLLLWRALPAALVFALVVRVHVVVRGREQRALRQRTLVHESAARIRGAQGPGAPATLPASPHSTLDAGTAGLRDEGPAHALDAWVLEDLGIDGAPPSLFQRLNTTQSRLAARRLRMALRTPLLEPASIAARQQAVRELGHRHEMRDALMLAFFAGRDRSVKRVPGFLARAPELPGGTYRVVLGVLGALVIPLLVFAPQVPWLWPVAGAAFLGVFALSLGLRRRSGDLRESYLELEPLLRSIVELAGVLEETSPESELLRAYRERFHRAVAGADRLQLFLREIQFLHLHEIGFLYGVVELLTAWDLHWLMALESRARRAPGLLEGFVEAASDLEALVALSVYCAESEGVSFPEVVAGPTPALAIRAGEHPLLQRGRVVPNDVSLGGRQRLAVVTGSNMAGKSTFLRMVALNAVLAQNGAPVRAASLRLTPLRLYANINVHDSLADGKSYFLVEVERVQAILAAAERDRFVLAVFDELFRGTNSTERLAASREIARTLAESGGLFLLATHEIELTRLVFEEAVEGVFALHFRDEIRDGRMTFPYTVLPGVGVAHNALRLLELSGYPPDLVARARAHAERHGPETGA